MNNIIDKNIFLVEFNKKGEALESWTYGTVRDYMEIGDDDELFCLENLLENGFDLIGTVFKYNVFGLFDFQNSIYISTEEEEAIRKIAKDYLMEFLYKEKVENEKD